MTQRIDSKRHASESVQNTPSFFDPISRCYCSICPDSFGQHFWPVLLKSKERTMQSEESLKNSKHGCSDNRAYTSSRMEVKDAVMTGSGRFHTIDAMRGIAALAVVFYHVHQPAFHSATGWLIDSLHSVFKYGFLGVPVFFAISGFVIAASMQRITGVGGFGRFMARRSIRLDPAYWASMALDIGLTLVAIRLALPHTDLPSLYQTLLHALYLQDLTQAKPIAAVYWTLCLEIQFYLVFGLIVTVGGKLKAPLFVGVTAYSMLVYTNLAPSLPGLFLSHWCMFIVGAAAYHYGMLKREKVPEFVAFMALTIIVATQAGAKGINLMGACIAAVFFYMGAMTDRLKILLNNPVLLYLGSRSYSLYLFHTIVGERAAKLGATLVGPMAANPIVAIGLLGAGVGASLIAAEVVYRGIERPTLNLSRKLFLGPKPLPHPFTENEAERHPGQLQPGAHQGGVMAVKANIGQASAD